MSETKKRPRPCLSYPYPIYVRASKSEKARIETLARKSQVSASRYLVELATQGRPPPTEEEREALRTLGFLLDRVGANLSRIAHRTNQAWMYGETLPDEREIEGVVKGVKLLTGEIRKRLRRR